jgi:hypothetical protein
MTGVWGCFVEPILYVAMIWERTQYHVWLRRFGMCRNLLHSMKLRPKHTLLPCRLSQRCRWGLRPCRAHFYVGLCVRRFGEKRVFISKFRPVLNVVCFHPGNSLASEFYMPTFRNINFDTYLPMKIEQTEFSETSVCKIKTGGNYTEESIQKHSSYKWRRITSQKNGKVEHTSWLTARYLYSVFERSRVQSRPAYRVNWLMSTGCVLLH